MSDATIYKWRIKHGGMDASLKSRMKGLESENSRLKKMYAEVQLQNDVIKKPWQKSGEAVPTQRDGKDCCLQGAAEYQGGVCGLHDQRDVLSLSGKAE